MKKVIHVVDLDRKIPKQCLLSLYLKNCSVLSVLRNLYSCLTFETLKNILFLYNIWHAYL